ncbi:hypothetical protein [Sphingobium sp. CECT 9361]|uniref:hypothetical protein n=1 Tax=Sphingobium sp. CECT 9361 TaxID=2845384 RepID=UPI001E2B0160|nr:hypothetical protein [Sphingobium sp. CECT 9361]CAH0353615.1 hypothetical protein SPH9361_02509 [Sphingobium sp. CECT 9361]
MLSIIAILLAGASPTTSQPTINCKTLCSVTQGRFTFLVAPRWLALVHIDGMTADRFTLRLTKSQKDFDIGRVFSGEFSKPIVVERNPRKFRKIRGRFALETLMADLEKAPAIYIDDCGYHFQSDPNAIVTNSFCAENLHGIGAAIASARKQMVASSRGRLDAVITTKAD